MKVKGLRVVTEHRISSSDDEALGRINGIDGSSGPIDSPSGDVLPAAC